MFNPASIKEHSEDGHLKDQMNDKIGAIYHTPHPILIPTWHIHHEPFLSRVISSLRLKAKAALHHPARHNAGARRKERPSLIKQRGQLSGLLLNQVTIIQDPYSLPYILIMVI